MRFWRENTAESKVWRQEVSSRIGWLWQSIQSWCLRCFGDIASAFFLSVCCQRVSHLHLPTGRVSGKKPLRIINDPSEHNFCNYRCSVIMLMLIHKELLFAQRVLCTLSPYLTKCVFAQQLWFACHVKWCLHLGACHVTRRSAEVLVHPHQKIFGWASWW